MLSQLLMLLVLILYGLHFEIQIQCVLLTDVPGLVMIFFFQWDNSAMYKAKAEKRKKNKRVGGAASHSAELSHHVTDETSKSSRSSQSQTKRSLSVPVIRKAAAGS
jgi:hypothetical protein